MYKGITSIRRSDNIKRISTDINVPYQRNFFKIIFGLRPNIFDGIKFRRIGKYITPAPVFSIISIVSSS